LIFLLVKNQHVLMSYFVVTWDFCDEFVVLDQKGYLHQLFFSVLVR